MDCCIICLSFCDPLERITTESLEWKREQIQRVVEKHLWWLYMQPESKGQLIKYICKSCWQEISSFHNFYLRVERIHKQNHPYTSSPLASNMENYEKQMVKQEISEYEEEGNECFDSCIKNEPINEDYEKTEYNYEIFEVEEPQYNDNHNHRMIGSTSDAEKQNYNYSSRYNGDEKEANNESLMRQLSMGNLKKIGLIDFYKEFQFKLECVICNSIESTFASLCAHYKNQHNMRGFAMCCGVKFIHRHLLIDHLCVHKDPNFFKCSKCHRVYHFRKNLKSHFRKNRCNLKHNCDQCGKQFLTQKNLLYHKLTHLKPIDKIFNCEKCYTPFESFELLQEHEKHIHAGIEEVLDGGENVTPIVKSEPPDCTAILQDKSIASKQSNTVKFKRKLKKSTEHRDNSEDEEDDHSNEEKEKNTSVCKIFRNMYTPSVSDEFFREMQYIMECNLCNIILPDFQSLITHYRVVHSTAGYGMCCGKKFYRRGILADHLKLHKDPNLFTCQLCSYRFSARNCLVKHIGICAKKFKKYE